MLITTNIQGRKDIFFDPAAARIAVESLYQIQAHYPFFLFGFVIMPDHCHILMNVPEGGSVSKTIGIYKRAVSFNIGRGPIWQSRFHIRLAREPWLALKYIHQNPVKAELCVTPQDYPWSLASGRWDVVSLNDYQ